MSPSSILAPTGANLERAVRELSRGHLVGMPTETVYGLAADATDREAVARIFAAKGRPATNPLIVHVAELAQAKRLLAPELAPAIDQQLRIAASLWPGPLTIVAPRSERVPDEVTAGRETVAIRVPAHPVALRLLRQCPFPLAAPSANRSNYVSPTRAEHVLEGLGDRVALILDGGTCRCGVESTILALQPGGPRLLRPGAVTVERLRELFGESLQVVDSPSESRALGSRQHDGDRETEPAEAPGMMPVHYSPRTPLVFAGQEPARSEAGAVGRIAFAPLQPAEAARYAAVETLSETGDLEEVARRLFAALRHLDQQGLDLIVTDRCQQTGIGRAIMDRLRRASGNCRGMGVA